MGEANAGRVLKGEVGRYDAGRSEESHNPGTQSTTRKAGLLTMIYYNVKRNGLGSGWTLDLAHTGAGTAHELAFITPNRARAQSPSPPAMKRPAFNSGVLSQSASRQSKAQPGASVRTNPLTKGH